MQEMQAKLLRFLSRSLKKTRSCWRGCKKSQVLNWSLAAGACTLPGLHAFLQGHDPAFGTIEYGPFRQLIFQGAINQALKSYGAMITVHENRGKVDRSRYALTWQASP